MAGGAGFIYDMIGSLRGNSALRNKPYRVKVKEAYQKIASKSNYVYKTASKEELLAIRELVRNELKSDIRKRMIVIACTILISIPIIYSMIYFLI